MKCSIVKAHIDGEQVPDSIDIEKHLESCTTCRAYFEEHHRIEEQLNALYTPVAYDEALHRAVLDRTTKKKFKPWMIAAALILALMLPFNSFFISLAESIPIIQDLLKLFERESRIEYAEEHGEPVHEYMFEHDGYTVLIKDVFVDSNDFTMFFTVVDEEGEFPKNAEVEIRLPQITGDSYSYGYEKDVKWWDHHYDVTSKIKNIDALDLQVSLRIDERVIIQERISINVEHMKTSLYKDIPLSKIYETPQVTYELLSMHLSPTSVTIKYQPISHPEAVEPSLNLIIVDSKGRMHYENGSYWNSESPVRTVEFTGIDMSKVESDFDILVSGYNYHEVRPIGYPINGELAIEHDANLFTLKQTKARGAYYAAEISNVEPISGTLYPEIAYLKKGNWVSAVMSHDRGEYFVLEPEHIEEAVGEDADLRSEDVLADLHKYIKQTYDVDLVWDDFIESMERTNGEYTDYIKALSKVSYTEIPFQMDLGEEFDEMKIGIIGDYKHIFYDSPKKISEKIQ